MSPLEVFNQAAKLLDKKPFEFLAEDEQLFLFTETSKAITDLKAMLEEGALERTMSYKAIWGLYENAISKRSNFDEMKFLQNLSSLVEIYQSEEPQNEDMKKLLAELAKTVSSASRKAAEYHFAM